GGSGPTTLTPFGGTISLMKVEPISASPADTFFTTSSPLLQRSALLPTAAAAVSPCSSRFCTPPIVAKLSSISWPVSRVNFAATSVTTYFTAPADKTFRCVAARETVAGGSIIQPSLAAAGVREGRLSLLGATCACRCKKPKPPGQADVAIWHRDRRGRTSCRNETQPATERRTSDPPQQHLRW